MRLCFVFVSSDRPAALNVIASLPVAREFALARPPPNECPTKVNSEFLKYPFNNFAFLMLCSYCLESPDNWSMLLLQSSILVKSVPAVAYTNSVYFFCFASHLP